MPSGPSVVVGRPEDLHTAAVIEAVEEIGGHPICLDASSLRDADIVIEATGAVVFNPEETDLRGARGWLRRLAPEDWREGIVPEGLEGVVRQAWTTALATLIELADVEWLSGLRAIFEAEDKLVQQRACLRIGVPCPPTAVVTRRSRIPSDYGQRLVVKPLAAGHYFDDEGLGRVVHAVGMDRDDERLDLLTGAPFLVQPQLDAASHVRVVTVRDQAWAAELPASDLPLDWRASEEAHTSFRPSDRRDLASKATQLADALGVGYSSQDWLIDHAGAEHFLDLNPAGQWLFLPDEVSGSVTGKIAEWLVSR